jgi:hypothetical protein
VAPKRQKKNVYKISDGKPDDKKPFDKLGCRLVGNVAMNHKDV